VKVLMDSYRTVLKRHNILVTTICPGFVRSELTANNRYPMPFILSAEQAARLIQRAIARRARTYVFPWQMRLLAPLLARVPDRMLTGYHPRT
jgi:short-subunit dehydrogenase